MDFTNSLSNNYAKKLVKLAKKSGVPTKSYYWCEKQLKQIEKDCGTFAKKDVMLQVTRDDPKAVKKGQKMICEENRPVSYHHNLQQYVMATIDTMVKNNLLLKSKAGIEEGCLEVLYSGDKSDDTFLMNFQIMNIANPQAVSNTRPVLLMVAPDTYENLSRVFDSTKLGMYSQICHTTN